MQQVVPSRYVQRVLLMIEGVGSEASRAGVLMLFFFLVSVNSRPAPPPPAAPSLYL